VDPGNVITESNEVNNTAANAVTVLPTADLSITKDDGLTTAPPGIDVTYTIVVTNDGPSEVIGATVEDILPADLINVSYTSVSTGMVSGNTNSWAQQGAKLVGAGLVGIAGLAIATPCPTTATRWRSGARR